MISSPKRETVCLAPQIHSITSDPKLFFFVKSRYLCIKYVDKSPSLVHVAMDSGMSFHMTDKYLHK